MLLFEKTIALECIAKKMKQKSFMRKLPTKRMDFLLHIGEKEQNTSLTDWKEVDSSPMI